MSRCYPYPPPGYDKKTNVELALSIKKEKHKHKDKKKKNRKDGETNGDLPRDLDKRSKKSHQAGVSINKDLSLANGSFPETKASSSEALLEKAIQRLPAENSNLSVGLLVSNGLKHETISKQGYELTSVPVMAACESNGAVTSEATSSSKLDINLRGEDHLPSIPRIETGWQALDDQEWLFHHNTSLTPVCKSFDEDIAPQVWAEAVLLPSVGIYALPYVVPD